MSRELTVNWQSGLKVVFVAFLGEITEQIKTTENLSVVEDRQSVSRGAGSGRRCRMRDLVSLAVGAWLPREHPWLAGRQGSK